MENLERLKRIRRPIRQKITRTANEVDVELAKQEPNDLDLRLRLDRAAEYWEEVAQLDQRILDALLDQDCLDEEQDREVDSIEEYKDKLRMTKLKIEKFLNPPKSNSSTTSESNYETASNVSSSDKQRSFKLPKIELKKFSGELSEWLGWWGQFSKIHEDESLHASDKFQYLVGCMVSGSEAEDIVKSYPPTEDNYSKAIEALEQRFGDKEILKEVYVRTMLKLVINNAKSKEKIPLGKLFIQLESNLRSFESLGVSSQQMALFLHPMVESSLDEDTLVAWQRSQEYGKEATPEKNKLEFLLDFLRKEVKNETQRSNARNGFEESKYTQPVRKEKTHKDKPSTAAGLHVGQQKGCIFCDKPHLSENCVTAQSMPMEVKRKKINEKRACFTCLKVGHRAEGCKGVVRCNMCHRKHFILMCPELVSRNVPNQQQQQSRRDNIQTASTNSNRTDELVLLKTIQAKVETPRGTIPVRILLDDGSQKSYVRRGLAEEANCQIIGSRWERNALFGGVLTDSEKRTIYRVPVLSADRRAIRQVTSLELADKPGSIASHIPRIPVGPWFQELKKNNIWLSDYSSKEDEIDILIGADLIPQLVTGRTLKLKCGLIAEETVLGWTLMGPVPKRNSTAMTVTSMMISEASVQQLWDLETLGIRDPAENKSMEVRNAEVQQQFEKTLLREDDGRYCVALPWVGGEQKIHDNRSVAEKRLLSTTNRLKRDGKFDEYDTIFKSWEAEGFIEEIKKENEAKHFLPHRAVYKPESETTPVRPVFDASAKTGRNPSLNDCLEKGPNFVEMIPANMLRFREDKIGVVADIRKAFQMLSVSKNDQNYLCFLWWEDSSCQKMKILRHRRVVFGANCSPFLLGATIDHHLRNVKEDDKEVAIKLLKSLYVDNVVTSVKSMQEYHNFKDHATRIMEDAKMELRQWEFGTVEETGIGSSECGLGSGSDQHSKDSKNKTTTNVLGMIWDKEDDTLRCETTMSTTDVITKRILLSTIQKVFDPMGFLSPAMIHPKKLMQETWSQELGWDEELPTDQRKEFVKWSKELNYLQQIKIPRNMSGGNQERGDWQLHTFCDASRQAYAAIVFLRVEHKKKVTVQLLQSKARVAPLKNISINRLELLGCFIASRLAISVEEALKIDIPKFFWTDSSNALSWIKGNNEWGTFVGNRVKEICRLTNPNEWRHVPGVLNPADLPSRGCTPKELLVSRWWEGPDWLKKNPEEWPHEELAPDMEIINSERKKKREVTTTINHVGDVVTPWYAQRFSSYISESWVGFGGKLTAAEIKEAEEQVWGMIQKETFTKNEETVKGVKVIKSKESGLIKVSTKLTHRQDTEDFRQPILLPHSHILVDRLIREEHLKNHHAGIQFLMKSLREKVWILQTRKAIRRVVHSCVKCRRFMTKAPTVPVAPLPKNRIKDGRAFEVTGVDLAGPLFLKNGSKCWIVLFTCGIYRAVHLELVQSLNTDSFVLALFRFMSRRGRPATIYSDNGTNFVGAENYFGKMDWALIQEKTRVERIDWHFNPPTAAWWGGFWERLVGTVKDLLKKMLGHSKLNYIQLETYLCEVEAVVNNRPLTYVTEDSDDLIPLTPSMFLSDQQIVQAPEVEVLDANHFRKKYRDLIQLKKELRERFRTEYLALLIHRGKQRPSREFKLGEIVLIANDFNKKRLQWPLAKVIGLYPGKDGQVRVARVKTEGGELERPLQRLIPLEVTSDMMPASMEFKGKAKGKREVEIRKDFEPVIVEKHEEEEERPFRRSQRVKKPNHYYNYQY